MLTLFVRSRIRLFGRSVVLTRVMIPSGLGTVVRGFDCVARTGCFAL